MTLDKKLVDDANSKRARKQKETPITVIIGNPPYSAGQKLANDNNQNTAYPQLNERIENTYVNATNAVLKRSLYDSYICAFRWASDRIGESGIICYVSNGGYIDGNAMDGFRKCLGAEFSNIYVFNLRGNARTSGEERRKEKGNVFGEGTRTPVAITLLIKNPANVGKPCTIQYHDIGDYLDRNEKLQIIADAEGLQGVLWDNIKPNEKHDWINQRDETFDQMIPLGDKKDKDSLCFFDLHSSGLKTSRDVWCWNFSRNTLVGNITRTIEFYNKQVIAFQERKQWDKNVTIKDFVTFDATKFSWDRQNLKDAEKGIQYTFDNSRIHKGTYRPFCKTLVYFDRQVNNCVYQMPQIFPEPEMENVVICLEAPGGKADFSTLITSTLPDLHLFGASQCFPFYTYELVESKSKVLIKTEGERVGDYIRRENISDAILQKFRERYKSGGHTPPGNASITKEDIFYYVYGILHSRSYRERFAADLKKQLPRIPLVDDFGTFSQAGRKLAELHLNYETGKMYPVVEIWGRGFGDSPAPLSPASFRMTKMRFPSKTDKSRIIYNDQLHLAGIPAEAYQYVVNGKSALEWIMERYAVTTHKDSGIVNDPNDWCKEIGNERYIVDLVKRIIHLSVESVKIIDGLPEVAF